MIIIFLLEDLNGFEIEGRKLEVREDRNSVRMN